MNLNDIPTNQEVVIDNINSSCQQLINLGLCSKLKIKKIQDGKNVVCVFCGSKLAISKELAENINIELPPVDLQNLNI
jgi:Fe2+ transport system protein FeoA